MEALLFLSLLVIGGLAIIGPHSPIQDVKAQPYSANVVVNYSFEQGLGINGYPLGWLNWTKHGGATCSTTPVCISLDTSGTRFVTGTTSAKLDLGNLTIGFIAIAQSLPGTLRFRNLTDRPDGIDMWFYYLPKYAGSGDIRIRVLYGENVGEIDYVFDPDPSLGYPNSTATTPYGPGGVKNIFLYGFAPGQWHHFQRNLRADWAAPLKLPNGTFVRGFSLDIPFPRIQFDALGFKSGTNYFSETVWIDDFQIYAESEAPPPPPPPDLHWINFTIQDIEGNRIDDKVKWKLFNNTGQEVPYTLGQKTLLGNRSYTLKVYYPTDTGQTPEPYLIYEAPIPLDDNRVIDLPMKLLSLFFNYYIAFNNPVDTVTINEYSAKSLTFKASGTAGISYTTIIGVARQPVLVIREDQAVTVDWSYDSARRVVTIRTDTLDKFTLFFETPPIIPIISLTDMAQQTVEIGTVELKILNSQGVGIEYQPGKILAEDIYYLRVDYKGSQIYRERLLLDRNIPIALPMLPLRTVPGGYAAFNTTAVSTAKHETSSQIDITIVGNAPILLIVDLPSKPLYILQNGQRIVTWSYNQQSKILQVTSATDGKFTIVLQEETNFIYYLVAAGAVSAGVIGSVTGILWRKRRNSGRQTSGNVTCLTRQTGL